jgi:hypothetical protein
MYCPAGCPDYLGGLTRSPKGLGIIPMRLRVVALNDIYNMGNKGLKARTLLA